MKFIFLICLILVIKVEVAICQEEPIKVSQSLIWENVSDAAISDDGKYVLYTINGISAVKVVRSTSTNWQRSDLNGIFFTGDSNGLVCYNGDTLLLLNLKKNQIKIIANHVSSYKKSDDNQLIAYRETGKGNELHLLKITTGEHKTFFDVEDYLFNDQSDRLVCFYKNKQGHSTRYSVDYIYLNSLRTQEVWSRTEENNEIKIGKCAFSKSGRAFVFAVSPVIDTKKTELWYYNAEMSKAECWAASGEGNLPGYLINIEFPFLFNEKGNKVFLTLKRDQVDISANQENNLLEIWNYSDEYFPTERKQRSKSNYLAMISKAGIAILEKEDDDEIWLSKSSDYPIGDYLVAIQNRFIYENWWQSNYQNMAYLVSAADGARTPLFTNPKNSFGYFEMSPDEKFIVWSDRLVHQYFSYQIATGVTRNISDNVPSTLFDDSKYETRQKFRFGTAGWVSQGGMLVYDHYDIWLLDLNGIKRPLNLTNDYGRKNLIILGMEDTFKKTCLNMGDEIVIEGFGTKNKYNGFYKIRLGDKKDPYECSFGPYIAYVPRIFPNTTGYPSGFGGLPPIKARRSKSYVVIKMSATESPNYFFTSDFTKFSQISFVRPELNHNWLTSELIRWKGMDGMDGQGVLYKPQDFDSSKKYPIIFHYYERRSDGLYQYLTPGPSNAAINIPQYVSNGYLVVVPDIEYRTGKPGESALNAVNAAADYMFRFSWVDSTRAGLQGHSFGGFETNYIVTHSKRFAAACAGAGLADPISRYAQGNSILVGGLLENGQTRIGGPPFSMVDTYIQNSPVLSVQRAETPLLLFHGRDDNKVPIEQSIEMFINMRRAGKKVWLIEYKNGAGHTLFGDISFDLDLRMRQFFDYYLKGLAEPDWMNRK